MGQAARAYGRTVTQDVEVEMGQAARAYNRTVMQDAKVGIRDARAGRAPEAEDSGDSRHEHR